MNIIAVDDEQLALKSAETAIKKALPDCALSCFTAPSKAILYAREHRVDVAFLDIQMGGMNGLQLAKCLKEIYAKTNIVFSTGYTEYALDAFSMNASGYLMKPITAPAIAEIMEQLRYPVAPPPEKRLRVQTFGNFEVFFDEKPLNFSRSKTKELFAYLVMRRGAYCGNNEIIAVIWEDEAVSPALQNHLRQLLLDLRQTLASVGLEDAVIKGRGQLAAVPDKFDCDFYEYCNGNAGVVNKYGGEFMAQYSWAEFANAYLDR